MERALCLAVDLDVLHELHEDRASRRAERSNCVCGVTDSRIE